MEGKSLSAIELWTDGANSGPKKEGGWAAILVSQDGTKLAISGFEAHTTNNRMELKAVIGGLEAVGAVATSVLVVTDSSYVKNAYGQGWLRRWQANGWISSRGDPVANRDLWEQLLELTALHQVTWRHVRGHQSHELNNLADAMAVAAKKTQTGVTELL